ncbi:acyl-CoA N-acyltransferase [Hypomontagnella submonticulosa]|nr:acyl-CoA N-acyltransferase [Hypomontagnella submonticulosa]
MAPQKRKRPHDAASPLEAPRRATRLHPEEPERQLRSGRVRAGTIEKPITTRTEPPVIQTRKSDAPRRGRPPLNQNRSSTATKEDIQSENNEEDNRKEEEIRAEGASVKPRRRSSQGGMTIKPSASSPPPPQTRLVPPKSSQKSPTPRSTHKYTHTSASSTTVANTSTPKRPTSTADKLSKPPPTPRSDRNIDKVVLGNICFKAWYPSYYGKEVLGDITSGNNVGAKERDGGGKIGGRIGGGKRAPPPMLDRLYVCPCCFKYSREIVAWWDHVRCCEKTFQVPGRKVYTHPRGVRKVAVRVPTTATTGAEAGAKGKGRKKSDGDASTIEEVVKDEGEWSVWEVDGEKDRLFCQNLSLFAKLFLDNKSVFFDVTGFNYFLLVYTPPPPPKSNSQPAPPTSTKSNTIFSQPPPFSDATAVQHPPFPETSRPQVVGFFSKEKLSWDNNNLACILVFPPWQRKGLGALLMGVSYEISRRENILGGPEKPISELGRKGYKRFWAGEIARWLLGFEGVGNGNGNSSGDEGQGAETLVTIEQCSKATWIVPEDCLAVLREMGVVEDAGLGPAEAGAEAGRGSPGHEDENPDEVKAVKMVPRVQLDKDAVRRWVVANRIDLSRTCDPEGFVEGYAIHEEEGEEMDED